MKCFPTPRSKGFTLIEMMIALVVLSIGLLGIAALQMRGQQYNHAAYIRTQATTLAYELMDRMRFNSVCSDDVLAIPPLHTGCEGGYATPPPAVSNCEDAGCTPPQLRNYDLTQWQLNLARFLPNGSGTVVWNGVVVPPVYDITITWQNREERDENENPIVYNQTWTFRP